MRLLLALLLAFTPVALGTERPTPVSDAATYIGQREHRITNVRAYVQQRASRAGWTGREWRCLAAIVHAESRFDPRADNPNSTAYGLFQQLRLEPDTPIPKQVTLGIRYLRHRYNGSPCTALRFRLNHGWY